MFFRVISKYLSKALMPQALPLTFKHLSCTWSSWATLGKIFGRRSGTWLFLNEKKEEFASVERVI